MVLTEESFLNLNSTHSLSICLIAEHFPIQGRLTDTGFLWPIAKGLAQRGHRVVVISARSPIGKQEIDRDGVKVFYLFESFPNYLPLTFPKAALKKFKEIEPHYRFQIVHSMDSSGVEIAMAKKKFQLAVAFDVEATQMSQIFSVLGMAQENVKSLISTGIAVAYKFLTTYLGQDREILKNADGMFVTSPLQRTFLERYYLYPDYHTYTVPYGLELTDLTPKDHSIEFKKKLKIPENSNVVLTISDMIEPEEVFNLLRAFEKVAIKKPKSYMILVGNGPAWKKIESFLLNLALGSRVIMTGALSPEEIFELISIGDVYVNMSSRTSGFEPSMIEAMAQKKVIIGSEMSPIADIVEDGIDGFLLRPADTLSLSNLLVEIFSGSMQIEEIGNKARNKIVNLFDTKKMVKSLEDSYLQILSKRKISKKPPFPPDQRTAQL
jgi:glycosyltransferase involved in cell wall biosynthesis